MLVAIPMNMLSGSNTPLESMRLQAIWVASPHARARSKNYAYQN